MNDVLLNRAGAENETIESLHSQIKELQDCIAVQKSEIRAERQKYEDLLRNVLPDEIFRELLKNGKVIPQYHSNVTVMFTDFVGFTSMCEKIELQKLIKELDSHFSYFDDICDQHYLEKIKTIGDAYLCVGGMPMSNHSHPFDAIIAAGKFLLYMNEVNERKIQNGEEPWRIRIGIHTGAVIAGVIGKCKFLYDIWGDTVNVASRMESGGEPGRINISETTYNYVKDYLRCTYRGKMPVKNKENIGMYFVEGLMPKYSADELGRIPNSDFKVAMRKL